MKRLCYVICVIVSLYGLEWQKLPDVPVGRGDDIAIGYTKPPEEQQIIYIADRFSWPYKSIDGGNTWDSLYLDVSARKPLAVVCNKNNADSVWIAKSERDEPEYKGVYFSFDGGGTWVKRDEGITNFKILCLNQAPDNPNFLFLGCEYEENNFNVFKTENGGEIWIPLGIIQNAYYIWDIETPSYLSNYIYAGTSNGVYESKDGGNTWLKTLNKNCFDVEISNNYVYVLCYHKEKYILYKKNFSENKWEIVKDFKYQENQLKGKIEIINSKIYLALKGIGLLKSEDGIKWEEIFKEFLLNNVKLNPKDFNIIYIISEFGFYKSIDGGNTWERCIKGFRKKIDFNKF